MTAKAKMSILDGIARLCHRRIVKPQSESSQATEDFGFQNGPQRFHKHFMEEGRVTLDRSSGSDPGVANKTCTGLYSAPAGNVARRRSRSEHYARGVVNNRQA